MLDTLPVLDLISGIFTSPHISFMQIRALRHVDDQYGNYRQIINVPAKSHQRNIDEGYSINVKQILYVTIDNSCKYIYLFGC